MQAWSVPFLKEDFYLLHDFHIFSVLSRILSETNLSPILAASSDECVPRTFPVVAPTEIKTPNRQQFVANLTDGSTETSWFEFMWYVINFNCLQGV